MHIAIKLITFIERYFEVYLPYYILNYLLFIINCIVNAKTCFVIKNTFDQ